MTFDQLLEFLTRRMRMSHIYQPLLVRALVDAGGTATLRQLAHAFLAQDESQLRFYEKRIKEMPLRVLSKHGVARHDGQLVSLAVPDLTYVQRAQLRMACEQRLQEYVQKRNLALWDYRLLDTDPVPDDLRYQALQAPGARARPSPQKGLATASPSQGGDSDCPHGRPGGCGGSEILRARG